MILSKQPNTIEKVEAGETMKKYLEISIPPPDDMASPTISPNLITTHNHETHDLRGKPKLQMGPRDSGLTPLQKKLVEARNSCCPVCSKKLEGDK